MSDTPIVDRAAILCCHVIACPLEVARQLERDNAALRAALEIIDVARRDSLTERPDAYELWELQLTREESAKVRAALAAREGGAK